MGHKLNNELPLMTLQTEQSKLAAMQVDLSEQICAAQAAVEASFVNETDTDKLAVNLSLLQSKHCSLLKAINTNADGIKQAHLDALAEETSKQIAIRKNAVIEALKANETATALGLELAKQFKIFNENVFLAGANSSEFVAQPRILVGRLALEFNLHGALGNAAVLPLLSVDDASKIQSKIR
jgi:hypothetical protein